MTASLYDSLFAYVHNSVAPEMSYTAKPSYGLAGLTFEVLKHSTCKASQLDLLKPLLTWREEPDPFAELLLELGEHLALGLLEEEGSSELLGEAFRTKKEAYKMQFASVYALEAMGDALTDYLLAKSAPMQPFASSKTEEVYRCKVMRLQDIEAAKFERYEAKLFDLSEAGFTYQELMLEFSSDAMAFLESLDVVNLVLRFVFDASFIELSSHKANLFDLEVNFEEKRIYAKLLLEQTPHWDELDSIIVRADSKP